ncbi:MAG: hypothetical protein JW982_16155 [Spirochaetes bacterium]|nr:hypothetical protein [Spirochaetota bacterium]
MNKNNLLKSVLLLCILYCSVSCRFEKSEFLDGISDIKPGTFTDLPGGRLYLPLDWKLSDTNQWPVTVVLHGYGELSRSLSSRYYWEEYAEELGIVLFFVETNHMGWIEQRNSDDTKLIIRILKTFRSQSWVKPQSIQLFGWSAGAIMAQGFSAINKMQKDGFPLFDKLVTASGGFGTVLSWELEKNPELKNAVRIPAFMFWGQLEPDDHGKDASEYLRKLGWQVDTATHPEGHVLDPKLVYEGLKRNRKN